MTFKLFFAFVGIALIIYAGTANALSLNLVANPAQIDMQQGTEYTIDMAYGIYDARQLTAVYTEISDYPKVRLLGNSTPIKMQDSYTFNYTVDVAEDAFPGIYNLEMGIRANDEFGRERSASEVIVVRVSEASDYLYTTSPNSNISPSISAVKFSNPALIMAKNDNASTIVSFKNSGSAADFNVVFFNVPEGIDLSANPLIAYNVCMNCEYSIYITAKSNESLQPGNYGIGVALLDLATNLQFNLGELAILAKPLYDAKIDVPYAVYALNAGTDANSVVLVNNTGYDALNFTATSNSELIQLQQKAIDVDAGESINVPFTIRAAQSTLPGIYAARIYFNGEISRVVEFNVEVKESSAPAAEPAAPEVSAIETVAIRQPIKNTTEETLTDVHLDVTSMPQEFSVDFSPNHFNIAPGEEVVVEMKVTKPKVASGDVNFDVIASGKKFASKTINVPAGALSFAGLAVGAGDIVLGLIVVAVIALLYVFRKGVKHFISGDMEAQALASGAKQ